MVKILFNDLDPCELTKQETLWFYNGLDCCVTREIYNVLLPYIERDCKKTYDFERGMLGPAMTMSRRGVAVNPATSESISAPLLAKQKSLEKLWGILTEAVIGEKINPRSQVAVPKLFYDVLGIPKITERKGGKVKVTTNEASLEKIVAKYPRGKLLARILLELRSMKKKFDVINTKLDHRNRFLTSFNVAGTETWRWSSSASSFRIGGNMQNITKELRRMLVADPGYDLFYADLDQAESLVVAYITGDKNYTLACHSGDLHTSVAKMLWPELKWTGDSKTDRVLAETPYIHGMTYRDLAKVAGHGTNYGLSPKSLQNYTKILLRDAWKFYLSYVGGSIEKTILERWHKQSPNDGFNLLIDRGVEVKGGTSIYIECPGAFPGIKQWHDKVAQQIEVLPHQITTPLGFTRTFWGNPYDATTLREAIAFAPQSTIGCLLHIGLWRIWNELDGEGVQLFGNVHDAVFGQVKSEQKKELLKKIKDCMLNPISFGDKELLVPVSIEVGNNWAPIDTKCKLFADGNPEGLEEWNV